MVFGHGEIVWSVQETNCSVHLMSRVEVCISGHGLSDVNITVPRLVLVLQTNGPLQLLTA